MVETVVRIDADQLIMSIKQDVTDRCRDSSIRRGLSMCGAMGKTVIVV